MESSAEYAAKYESQARRRLRRAQRVRERAGEVPARLAPLQVAMARRAAELELSAAALVEIAAGQRRLHDGFTNPV